MFDFHQKDDPLIMRYVPERGHLSVVGLLVNNQLTETHGGRISAIPNDTTPGNTTKTRYRRRIKHKPRNLAKSVTVE